MWEGLVLSAFLELILAFYPRDLLWGLLYRRDAPEVRTTLYSWITYISDPHRLWKFERNRWDGMCHACLVFSWTDLRKLFLRIHFIFFFQSSMIRKRYSAPTFFYVIWIELFGENPRKFHFQQPRLAPSLLLPNDMAENFPRFLLLWFLSIRSCSFNVIAAIVKVFRSPGSRGPRSDLVLVPWSRVGWGRFPVSVKLFIQLPQSKSLSTVP